MTPQNVEKIEKLWKNLGLIRAAANAILQGANKNARDYGAVNWADLHVVESGIKISDDAEIFPYLVIEEASPDCALGGYVAQELLEYGWGKVEVATEW